MIRVARDATALGVTGERTRGPRPATRCELWSLVAYFLVFVALTDALNVRPSIELLTVSILVPAILITRQPVRFARDWWFVLVGLVMWNLSGPIAALSPFRFHPHLNFMLNLDRALFLGQDPVPMLQRHLADGTRVGPVDVLASVAYNLHLAEPYFAGYLLWRLNRIVYLQFISSVLVLLVLGYVTFIVFPAVPPWLAAEQYHRVPGVINRFGLVLHAHPVPFTGSPVFSYFHLRGDPIAAMPSEHAALPLLELLSFARLRMRAVTLGLALWVLVVLFSIVYLGEHWVTDALFGYVYALLVFGFVLAITQTRVQRPATA